MPTQKWTCEKCGTSYDTFQDAIDCERSHKSKAKGFRGARLNHVADADVSEKSRVYLMHEVEQDAQRWGCHINVSDSYSTKQDPDWLKLLSFPGWGRRGVVVWDRTTQTVARMRVVDVLELLTDLQSNAIGEVTVVGERREVHSPNHQLGQKPPYILANKISLDMAQANTLLSFLQVNEPLLQKMAKEDKAQWDAALRSGYKILIRAYLRIQAEKQAKSE